MDKTMSQPTWKEVLAALQRRYQGAGREYRRQLLKRAKELLGPHRKATNRALRSPAESRVPPGCASRQMGWTGSAILRL